MAALSYGGPFSSNLYYLTTLLDFFHADITLSQFGLTPSFPSPQFGNTRVFPNERWCSIAVLGIPFPKSPPSSLNRSPILDWFIFPNLFFCSLNLNSCWFGFPNLNFGCWFMLPCLFLHLLLCVLNPDRCKLYAGCRFILRFSFTHLLLRFLNLDGRSLYLSWIEADADSVFWIQT